MLFETDNLLEDVKKCLTDPVFDVTRNFSLKKSREYYEKWEKAWNNWNYKQNPAVKEEEVSFDFGSLSELWLMATQAHNMYVNLKREDFNKWVDWYIYWQNIVVGWYRLKTFDEWLHDWLRGAISEAYQTPEDWVRILLERELGKWVYTNTAIHLYAEGKISKEILKRLGTYEKYMHLEDGDIEEDIIQAKKSLEDIEECNKVEEIINMLKRRNTTVLKLKK